MKWSKDDSTMRAFERFFNPSLTLDVMLQQIRQMIDKIPAFMGQIIKFACLIGLRPAEVVESVKLINNQLSFPKYYNADNQTLEHFRFSKIFIRTTKKAYISFVTPEMLEIVRCTERCPSYQNIRLACWKIGIKMEMRFCRKIFASWLHKC